MPADVSLLTKFVNTFDLEEDKERLSDAAAVSAWFHDSGLPGSARSEADVRHVQAVREALRAVLWANNGGPLDPAAVEVLRSAAHDAPLRISFDDDGAAELEPAVGGVGAAIGRLLAVVERAQAEGIWHRLKACGDEDCRWAFYDKSRNRSRTWCDMAVCGNRAKARSYRARGSSSVETGP
jgi:predicted RNA-binding Zn ribbon-like protein